jgi:trans-aconitate 2-methyltransferase
MPREWNAVKYDAQPLPHENWGRRTIERLAPAPTDTVLDAGAGTGRDAQSLLKLLPQGRVVAVDGSVRMLERLRERLAGDLDRVDVVQADLGAGSLPLAGPVDSVVSVACFHWIPNHDALFSGLAEVLRPGGRLVTDCGGAGNIATVAAAVEQILGPQPSPWNFAGVPDTEDRLRRAGFTDLDVRLRPDPAAFGSEPQLLDYLLTVVLGGQLDRMPADEHDDFVRAVAGRLPAPVVDYVRLEITATRA